MKILVIGDTHFGAPPYITEHWTEQFDTLKKIIQKESPSHIIFLGDLFHHRQASVRVLLMVKKFFDSIRFTPGLKRIIILRGNHDSVDKSDSGETELDLLTCIASNVKIIQHTVYDGELGIAFIPHYEDANKVLEDFGNVIEQHKKSSKLFNNKKDLIVMGHWGYKGSLPGPEDSVHVIREDDLSVFTILGHLHRPEDRNNLCVLGTPYSTSFQEVDYIHRYGVLENEESNWIFTTKEINFGIRHLVFGWRDLESNKTFIDDPNYYTILRVILDLECESPLELRKRILEEYNVKFVEERYDIQIPDGLQPCIRDDFSFNTINSIIRAKEDILRIAIDEETSFTEEELSDTFDYLCPKPYEDKQS